VGKTHFLHAFLFGEDNTHDICPTLAVEFYERVIVLGQYEVAVRIWDSSGNQKYRSIVPHHLRECELIVLMYDITD
jgi:GTPase SAR1 family protein